MRGVFRCLLFAGTRVLHQILPMPIECLERWDSAVFLASAKLSHGKSGSEGVRIIVSYP